LYSLIHYYSIHDSASTFINTLSLHDALPILLERTLYSVRGGLVDDDARPLRIGDVTMLLPVVSVRLVEHDVVSAVMQGANDPAVVGRRAVPIRRDQARSEHGDVRL